MDKFASKIMYNMSEVSYGVVKDLEILLRKFQSKFFLEVFRYIFAIKSINKNAYNFFILKCIQNIHIIFKYSGKFIPHSRENRILNFTCSFIMTLLGFISALIAYS